MSPKIWMRSFLGLSLACCLLLVGAAASVAPLVPATACNGTIAQCLAGAEFLMDSETNRRMLQGGDHITYPALHSDTPFCNPGRGKPYINNCVPQSNGRRGRPCLDVYRCGRNTGSPPS